MKVANKENRHSNQVVESSRQVFVHLMEYLRTYASYGDIEIVYAHALQRLHEAKLSNMKRILFEEELKDLLIAGFEAEAWNNLQEARGVSKVTDACQYVTDMYGYLLKAGIDGVVWLEMNGSSLNEINLILERGTRNRAANLCKARMR